MREVAFRPRAQYDLESIYLYQAVVLGAPQAAQNTIESIYAAVDRIACMSTAGQAFKASGLTQEYRRILADNHWIFYTFDEESVCVWRIFHTRQDIDDYGIESLTQVSLT